MVRNGGVDASVDNMLKITNDGRKLALDQRLVNELLPDDPGSKVSVCAEKSYEIWKDTVVQKSAQIIFCDLSTPKGDGSFNVYDDLEDVKKNGSGKSYLIQHSAGSGKSNSIAWLAHRLTGLHDYEDNKIFQSVIIVTDRRVLDSQLQSTVYQFDHVEGVVKKVDKNSGQLRDAINDGVGIIITTLQKFPVIYKEVDSAKKRFAIIIDEAHSSQTGDAAKKLKRALADTEEILKEYAEMEDQLVILESFRDS